MTEKRVFVASPIGADESVERKRSDKLLAYIISPVVEELGNRGIKASLIRGDKIPWPGRISKQIIEEIVRCDVMIADVTGNNANVFYEIGLRQALLKPYILMAEKGHRLPFDLADIRTIYYQLELDTVDAARAELDGLLERALKGEVSAIDQELLAPSAAQTGGKRATSHVNVQILEAVNKILQEVAGFREKLDHFDRLTDRVEQIKSELDKIDYAARYGRAPAHLVNLLRLKNHIHGQAVVKQ